MEKTINRFIEELKQISPDKRELPLVIDCPNGMETYPSIKMRTIDGMPFSDLKCMVITWQD